MTMAPSPHSALPVQNAYGQITDQISAIPLARGFHPRWLMLFGLALSLTLLGAVSVTVLISRGVGVWGVNVPVAWGFAIINFVWWIGIGHAGTLISAILLLLRQRWRTSINRFAEAMTLFAVANAGIFPLLHLGRIWKFYYLFPYPDTLGLWPQWRSPLVWDVFAILTYSLVSFLFWYLGLVPDLATLRDRAQRRPVAIAAGIFALGWRGSARHWHHYQTLYLLLAGLATPLVVSVHSIVSLDFAVSVVPGWHSTIYPPFFVAGAIYSGFAMVLMIAIPLRRAFGLQGFITTHHLDVMAKVMLTAGLIVGYGYVMENFTSWYSGDQAERSLLRQRALGVYAPFFWAMILFNAAVSQSLWLRTVRTSPIVLFLVALLINLGMWLERFVIVVVSLYRDHLPSSWGWYVPTFWDLSLLLGSLGFFTALMLLFIRFLPMISMFEVREDLHHDFAGHDPPPTSAVDREQSIRPAHAPEGFVGFGLAGQYADAGSLVRAVALVRSAGYRRWDAYSPFPIGQLPEVGAFPRSPMPRIVLAGAMLGALSAYVLQWYSSAVDYPLNVAGRPDHSWPSFVPLTFELAVLGGAVFGVAGLMVLNHFPEPYHPLFGVPEFARASCDSFFLCVESCDERFDLRQTRTLLADSGASSVWEVPS